MKSPSLRLRLTFFISGILLLACFITTSISYFELKNSLKQVFDSQQLLFAKRLAALNSHGNMMMPRFTLEPRKIDEDVLKPLDYDDDALAFAIFNRKGEMIVSDGEKGAEFEFSGGFFPSKNHPAMITEQGKWRILWLLSNDNRAVIAVGQKLDYQHDILVEQLYKQLIPWLITFVIVIGFVVILINRSFSSIGVLANNIALRQPEDDTPIGTDGAPKEIRPFINALNILFAKISSTIMRERQFISDAAHELRTPLAALRVQTEVAQLSDDDPISRQNALNNLKIGIDRSSHLVDQLLTLSRIDALDHPETLVNVDWFKLVSNVVDELKPIAEQKQIQITIHEQVKNQEIKANSLLLSLLVRNIINNAIRYIPEQGLITITINEREIIFLDNGNGVSEETLSRLGERFYRPVGQKEKGSGLGLSIVKKIAQLHNITVKFDNLKEHGFAVTLRY